MVIFDNSSSDARITTASCPPYPSPSSSPRKQRCEARRASQPLARGTPRRHSTTTYQKQYFYPLPHLLSPLLLLSSVLLFPAHAAPPSSAGSNSPDPSNSFSIRRQLALNRDWISRVYVKGVTTRFVEERADWEFLVGGRTSQKHRVTWPDSLVGSTWRSANVKHHNISLKDPLSCRGLLPPAAYTSRVSLGRPAFQDELFRLHRRRPRDIHDSKDDHSAPPSYSPISPSESSSQSSFSPLSSPARPTSVESDDGALLPNFPRLLPTYSANGHGTDLDDGQRWLIWVPRAGLGNMLRALSSAYVYALLSGRRLLRWHGGQYGDAMRSLCAGFACGFDEIRFPNRNLPNYAEPLDRLVSNGEEMRRSLADPRPLVIVTMSSSFDKYWKEDKELAACVKGALGCASDWCVWSRTMEILLGKGPTELLREEIEKYVRVFPHVKSASSSNAKALNEAKGEAGEVLEGDSLRRSEGGVRGSGGLRSGMSVEEEGDAGIGEKEGVQVARRLSGGASRVGEGGEGREGVGGNQLAEGTGLRLKFDVSLHIRTGDWSFGLPHCGDSQACLLQRSQVAADVASLFLQASHWLCLSSLLQLFRFRKWAAEMRTAGFQSTDARAAKQVDRRWASLAADEEWAAKVERSLSMGTRVAKQVLRRNRTAAEASWTLDDSLAMAHGLVPVLGRSPRPTPMFRIPKLSTLHIFLSTDNEYLRPIFVELLQPFGSVFVSTGQTAHLSMSTLSDSKLSTVADFFLLSRGAVLVGGTQTLSTFAKFAGIYANCSVVFDHSPPHRCHYAAVHL